MILVLETFFTDVYRTHRCLARDLRSQAVFSSPSMRIFYCPACIHIYMYKAWTSKWYCNVLTTSSHDQKFCWSACIMNPCVSPFIRLKSPISCEAMYYQSCDGLLTYISYILKSNNIILLADVSPWIFFLIIKNPLMKKELSKSL